MIASFDEKFSAPSPIPREACADVDATRVIILPYFFCSRREESAMEGRHKHRHRLIKAFFALIVVSAAADQVTADGAANTIAPDGVERNGVDAGVAIDRVILLQLRNPSLPIHEFINSKTNPVRGEEIVAAANFKKLEPLVSRLFEPAIAVGPPPKSKFHGQGPSAADDGIAQLGEEYTGR